MSVNKQIKARQIQKHDIEENWKKAENFIPLIGEIIIYDPDGSHDESRVKIGDGIRNISELPFVLNQVEEDITDIQGNIADINDSLIQLGDDITGAKQDFNEQIEKINATIQSLNTLKRHVLQLGEDLPQVSQADINTIYMKPIDGENNNFYEEYIVVEGKWELIGTTKVDLTGYATQDYVDEKIATIPGATSQQLCAIDDGNGAVQISLRNTEST